MNYRKVLTLGCACTAALISVSVRAASVSIPIANAGVAATFDEDINHFVLTFQGLDVTQDFGQIVIPFGSFWKVSFTLNLKEEIGQNNPSDLVTIQGTAYHLVGPHGEAVATPPVTFALSLSQGHDTGLLKGVSFETSGTQTAGHGQHLDTYTASALSHYRVNSFDKEITSWQATISGVHAVPEPGSSVLALSGLLVAGLAARRRKKHG